MKWELTIFDANGKLLSEPKVFGDRGEAFDCIRGLGLMVHKPCPVFHYVQRAVVTCTDNQLNTAVKVEWWGVRNEQKLFWFEIPEHLQVPKRIMIMNEYGGTVFWDQYGVGTWIGDDYPEIPGVLEVCEEISKWNDVYDYNVKPSETDYKFPWDTYHARGLELAKTLKNLLSERIELFFMKAYEDPDYTGEIIIVR